MRQTLPVLPTVLLSYEQLLETLCVYFNNISCCCQEKISPYGLAAIHLRLIEVGVFLPH